MKLVTEAIIAALEDANLLVGDGVRPETGSGWDGPPDVAGSTFTPYVVVHPMPGGRTDGTIRQPHVDAAPLYQLSSYGRDRAQCEWMADKAHTVMTSSPAATFEVAGRKVQNVIVDNLGGAMRLDEMSPPEWQATARYRLMTTPSP